MRLLEVLWHGCLFKEIVWSNAGRLNVWITQRLSWLPFVLLSIVFIMSTLSLWRLHCETLRIQCNARPSLPGCWVCTNCAIFVTYARPTYSDRVVESPQKSIYIEAYRDVLLLCSFPFTTTSNTLPFKLADIFTPVSCKINLTKIFYMF